MTLDMNKEDLDFIWSLMPGWVKEQPEGLFPVFYGTLSCEGDKEICKKIKKILNKD